MTSLAHLRFTSPLGDMLAVAHDGGLVLLEFHDRRDVGGAVARIGERFGGAPDVAAAGDASHPVLRAAREQMLAYFAGERTAFDLPLDPPGDAGAFERRCWDYLSTIPLGETRTYGEQAAAVGSPGAARAVGRANGRNFLAVVVPCHRVVGSTGALTGYGGGVDRKRWLLAHERRHAPVPRESLFAAVGG